MIRALFAVALALSAANAYATELTADEMGYLEREFGLCESNPVRTLMTPAEAATLHEIFVDPWSATYPSNRDMRLSSALMVIYGRQCREATRQDPSATCTPAADPALRPGKAIADRQCSACHLFGTGDAQPFFRLANRVSVTADYLESVLENAEHRMSPLHLGPSQRTDLASYINSVRCDGKPSTHDTHPAARPPTGARRKTGE